MPEIVLHGPDGEPLRAVRIPTFEHAPRAVVYGDDVFVDLTRSHRDYYQVSVYEIPLTREENLEVMAALVADDADDGAAAGRVAGAYHSGSGV